MHNSAVWHTCLSVSQLPQLSASLCTRYHIHLCHLMCLVYENFLFIHKASQQMIPKIQSANHSHSLNCFSHSQLRSFNLSLALLSSVLFCGCEVFMCNLQSIFPICITNYGTKLICQIVCVCVQRMLVCVCSYSCAIVLALRV